MNKRKVENADQLCVQDGKEQSSANPTSSGQKATISSSLGNDEGSPENRPSSSGQATSSELPQEIIRNDDDEELSMDSDDEADGRLSLTEHQIRLDQERRKWQQEQKEEKETLLRQKEEEKETLRRESDAKYEMLLEQFEDMKIRVSKYRQKLRKRPPRKTLDDSVTDNASIEKQECLVLFSSRENQVYAYRRQLGNIVPAIYKQQDKILEFIGWFITDNAVSDYNRCKDLVKQKASECSLNVSSNANELVLDEASDEDFDLPQTVCTTLRIEMKVVEADVRILGKLFDKEVRSEGYVAATDAKAVEKLKGVYKYIEEHHARFVKYQEGKLVK